MMNPPGSAGIVRLSDRIGMFDWYRGMRRADAVSFDPHTGGWRVFGYDDVQRVLLDYATFSSERSDAPTDTRDALGSSIISLDPPRHHRLRALVSKAFTPRAVADLAPRIEA